MQTSMNITKVAAITNRMLDYAITLGKRGNRYEAQTRSWAKRASHRAVRRYENGNLREEMESLAEELSISKAETLARAKAEASKIVAQHRAQIRLVHSETVVSNFSVKPVIVTIKAHMVAETGEWAKNKRAAIAA